jgi:hypothetical protein
VDKINRKATNERREQEIVDLLSGVVSELTKSPRIKQVLVAVLRDVLKPWSNGNIAKRTLSAQAIKIISAILKPDQSSRPKIEGKDIGKLVTLMAQNTNEKYVENPMHMVDHIKGPLLDFIKYVDFGELKELLDRAEEPVVELVKSLIGFIWKTYPAKLGAVLSFMHPLGNMVVKSAKEIVAPLNTITPDLFADLIFAILGSIDGKAIGELTNGILELARQIHTGSLLQGESGVSHFQLDLTKKLREIFSGIDPVLYGKVKVIGSEHHEERANAVADIMMENPDLVLGLLAKYSAIQNPKIRKIGKKISVYESLPQEEFGEALSDGISQIDTQGIAGIVNSALRLVNEVHENKPEVFSGVIRDIMNAIDEDELKTATQWIFKDIRDAIKPIEGIINSSFAEGAGE